MLQLRFVDEGAWVDARRRLTSRVASHGQALVGQLELSQSSTTTAWLFVTTSDPDHVQRWEDAVVSPWLAASALASPPTTTDTDVVWSGPTPDDGPPLADAELVARFVAEVTHTGRVWGLYGETWARADPDTPGEVLPFWSNRAAAARCVRGAWLDFIPRAVELEEFISQWLSGMVEDRIAVVISPRPSHRGALFDPAKLSEALVTML